MEPGWKPVQPHELPLVLQRPKTGGDPCLVIDTREPAAYFEAHIDGSINVPVPTFTPRSGAEFGHMYSLTQLESDLDPKAARRFQGRKGRRVLVYDDGQGTEPGVSCSPPHFDKTAFSELFMCYFLPSNTLLPTSRSLPILPFPQAPCSPCSTCKGVDSESTPVSSSPAFSKKSADCPTPIRSLVPSCSFSSAVFHCQNQPTKIATYSCIDS
jgi:rhodanese-related sulfurtransferase